MVVVLVRVHLEWKGLSQVQENTAIEKAFNLEIRGQLHIEIVKMFYSAGLPFHLTRNPYYVRLFLMLQIII